MVSPQYLPLGSQLLQQVPNPFYGKITNGVLSFPTVSRGPVTAAIPTVSPTANGPRWLWRYALVGLHDPTSETDGARPHLPARVHNLQEHH